MKIAITVDPEIPVPPLLYGGIERIVSFLVNGLVKRGHEVVLYANSESKAGGELISLPGRTSRGLGNTIMNSLVISGSFLKGVDLVHSFSRLAYLTPLLGLKTPKIMSYQREPTISQILKARRLDLFSSLTFTGCSNYISNQIKPYARAVTIYNGVEVEKYQFSPMVGPNAPLVFLGRIQAIKGTHVAIEVAKRTGRHLIIAGNIPVEKEHEQYFASMIKPHINGRDITYLGPVDDLQKNELLGKAAALLMPISWNEPFGIVMAEAMACGTPVIGIANGAVPELISHGIDGFVTRDVEGMINSVPHIERIDRRKVRKKAEDNFSAEVIVAGYEALYEARISV